MATQTQTAARFTKGEQVLYMGSVARVQGWLFRVVTRAQHADGQWLYGLQDDTWGMRLFGVREASLRGPHDG
jgi:hypothetical protein